MSEDVLLRESAWIAAQGTKIALNQLAQVSRNLTLAILYYQQGKTDEALSEIAEIDGRLREANAYMDRNLDLLSKVSGHASEQ